MKKRFNTKLLVLLLLLFSICCIVGYKTIDNRKISISMKEAYKIANNAAYEKNAQLLLVSITSTDDSLDKENISAGSNGTRKSWNFEFAVPNSTEHWFVSIRDNKIEDVLRVTGIPYEKEALIDRMELRMDSKEALKIAKKEYILKPGEIWAIGYHFSISKEDGKILLQVICRDNSDTFTRISIDVRTKQILEAIHKVSNGGGIFNGANDKALINNYDIDGITNYVAPNKDNNLFAWGKKIINIIQYEPIILYKKGKDDNWNELKFSNIIRNVIPITENSFFVICDKNIYIYDSKQINNELELKDNILNSIYYMDKLYIITKSQLHFSSDKGESWSIISLPAADDITNISMDFDESNNILYISISNKIYGLNNKEWIEFINNDEMINDFKYINNTIIYATNKSINIYDLKSKEKKFTENLIIKRLIRYRQAYLYAINEEGKLFKIKKGGDNNDWIIVDCKTNNNGLISDVLHIDKNIWYYSTISISKWVGLRKL